MSEYQNLLGQAYRSASEPGENTKWLLGYGNRHFAVACGQESKPNKLTAGLGGAAWGEFCRNAAGNITKAANAREGNPIQIPAASNKREVCSIEDALCPHCRENLELDEHPQFDDEEFTSLDCRACGEQVQIRKWYEVSE